MERFYPKSYGGYSYEIMDEKEYERFWWGKRPSSKEAFEAWLFDPHKTQHQIMKEYGKKNITFSNVGYNMREMMKAGIIRRFQREDYEKSEHKKRRNEIDIFAEILYLANEGGVTKTSMVYQANLNFVIIDRFLSELLDRALIEFKDKLYETTDKGVTFLHHYEELGKLGMAS